MKELTGWSDESDETPDNVRSQLDQMHWRVLNRRQNQSPTVRRSDIHVVSGNVQSLVRLRAIAAAIVESFA